MSNTPVKSEDCGSGARGYETSDKGLAHKPEVMATDVLQFQATRIGMLILLPAEKDIVSAQKSSANKIPNVYSLECLRRLKGSNRFPT